MLLSCVRATYLMANIAGFFPLLWYINTICYPLGVFCFVLFFFTIPFSSSETVLSTKMSSSHHFMFSVDHSTADTMRPCISKGYLLGSVNSTFTPPFPNCCLPSLPAVSPSLLVCQHSHIHSLKDQLTCLHHIYGMHTSEYVYMFFCSQSVAVCPLKWPFFI